MLSRLPAVTLADFQKGDAVILVSTEGSAAGVTAITMVGGVEPILTASPGEPGDGAVAVESGWRTRRCAVGVSRLIVAELQ